MAAEQAVVIDAYFFNDSAHHWEVWLRGPEGYRVVVVGRRDRSRVSRGPLEGAVTAAAGGMSTRGRRETTVR
ncbi:MAG TPA: hypothetical protein ENK23_03035 [Sorangium sp.]|nr:hypothetical protein [Sorangium sp.]